MSDFISSRQNPTVKRLLTYRDKPSREAFLIEGFHLVEMAYMAGYLDEVYGTVKPKIGNVPYTEISPSVLEKLCISKTPEGVVGVAHLPEVSKLGERALLLDRVQDPGNVGTLLRSALSFGYHDVILLNGCASPLKAKTVASSQGAIFKLNLIQVSEEEALSLLKQNDLPLVATALEGATPLSEFKLPARHVLALGNEGQGLSARLLDASAHKVKIEMEGIDSLNVAIAGSILMYEFSRR